MEGDNNLTPSSPFTVARSDDAQTEFLIAPSERSATSSRFSITQSEITVSPSEISTRTDTERYGRAFSEGRSDVTVSSAVALTDRYIRDARILRPKRNPNIYDCVAGDVRGKATSRGLYRHQPFTQPYSAAEFFFEQLRAVFGNKNEDARLYWHRELDSHHPPQSDILWAIHRYASQFFARDKSPSLKFMDESALLALGILVEETMKDELGETGFLAFLVSRKGRSGEERASCSDTDTEAQSAGPKSKLLSGHSKRTTRKHDHGEDEADNMKKLYMDDFLTDNEDEDKA
ncbi:uncharacterized protein PV09_05603 [Verruconis gallopava]|uniref:Uncharacterized protein n=1 Tax=Verruconis gallopava TaxID=253628 RepID=A0A0D2A9H3_9PEZI|nr:uncharacterized protein PV09_05603 [Verruconis gallopava]KIW03398.1 hypothetical protein PV09_05603 [Verruconis gallopava]